MSKGNLIPTSLRSKEEARELGRRGGIQSGISRRAKRDAREVAKMLLDEIVEDEEGKKKTRREIILKDITSGARGKDGDLNKAKYLFDLAGEAPKETIDLNVSMPEKVTLIIEDGD